MKTYHRGADEERQAWMKHLRRMLLTGGCATKLVVTKLLCWGRSRKRRYRKRKGGL